MKTLDFQVVVNAQEQSSINEFCNYAQNGVCNWCTELYYK